MKLNTEGAVARPDETYKDFERGVRTPAAQVVYFSAGATLVYMAIATAGLGNLPTVDILRWAVFTFLFTLGLGLMVRMAGPSLKSAIERYAAARAWQEREQMEGRIAYLEALLEQAGIRNLASDTVPAFKVATLMIEVQAQRMATGRGITWARNEIMRAYNVRRKDWETAREMLEGAGIRDPRTGEFIAANAQEAKARLAEFLSRPGGRYRRSESGTFTKVG